MPLKNIKENWQSALNKNKANHKNSWLFHYQLTKEIERKIRKVKHLDLWIISDLVSHEKLIRVTWRKVI